MIWIVVILSGLFVGCYVTKSYNYSNSPLSVATIVKLDIYQSHGNSYHLYEFNANDGVFEARTHNWFGFALGEKFVIQYDSFNPDRFRHICLHKPIFLMGEETGNCIALTKRVKPDENTVVFTYQVGDKCYTKMQFLEKEAWNYNKLSSGTFYLMEYLLSNPQRSIIQINEPVNEMDKGIAVITNPFVYVNGFGTVCKYLIITNSDTVEGMVHHAKGLVTGEKFRAVLVKRNGKVFIKDVIFYEPLFTIEDKTAFANGELQMPKADDHYITFNYTVNNIAYQKTQMMSLKASEVIKLLEKVKSYKVEYDLTNPTRAKLYFPEN